jgi:hypothetical protein
VVKKKSKSKEGLAMLISLGGTPKPPESESEPEVDEFGNPIAETAVPSKGSKGKAARVKNLAKARAKKAAKKFSPEMARGVQRKGQ